MKSFTVRSVVAVVALSLLVLVVLVNFGVWREGSLFKQAASGDSTFGNPDPNAAVDASARRPPVPAVESAEQLPERGSPSEEASAQGTTVPVESRAVDSGPSVKSSTGASPVSIYYVDPVQYMTNHVQYVRDQAGNARLNAILLPPDLEAATGKSDRASGGFIGSESCVDCHREYYEGFVKTSHHRTSAKAEPQAIRGSFAAGKNFVATKSPSIRFEMEVVDGAPLQRMLINSNGEEFGADFQFDLVTGSGKLGQTYLYWKDERLYQLHVSYLTEKDSWVNSPGYVDGTANFARPVMAPCLECHATYFESVGGTTNHFRTDNFVLGVSCERCHGPAREHVEHHRASPDDKVAHAITNPASFTNDLALDMCQVCHGGMPTGLMQPAFTFRAGNRLAEHYEFAAATSSGPATIHSNSQLPRLQASKCFQSSESMTCTDCHDPHQFERGDMKLFSDRCVTCHQPSACGKFAVLGEKLRENCIDCHMPPNQAADIKIASEGEVFKPTMRDHHIRISAEATAKYLGKP